MKFFRLLEADGNGGAKSRYSPGQIGVIISAGMLILAVVTAYAGYNFKRGEISSSIKALEQGRKENLAAIASVNQRVDKTEECIVEVKELLSEVRTDLKWIKGNLPKQ